MNAGVNVLAVIAELIAELDSDERPELHERGIQARAAVAELIAAANYVAFAMRDGAVWSRDHAAQRLAAAAAAAGDSA